MKVGIRKVFEKLHVGSLQTPFSVGLLSLQCSCFFLCFQLQNGNRIKSRQDQTRGYFGFLSFSFPMSPSDTACFT